jgi:hypothetical protein
MSIRRRRELVAIAPLADTRTAVSDKLVFVFNLFDELRRKVVASEPACGTGLGEVLIQPLNPRVSQLEWVPFSAWRRA